MQRKKEKKKKEKGSRTNGDNGLAVVHLITHACVYLCTYVMENDTLGPTGGVLHHQHVNPAARAGS